jgi:putative toxin-antitoxin system antitoxin component (TIGR02293 family)
MTTWTPPRTIARSPGRILIEHIFGERYTTDVARRQIGEGFDAGVFKRFEKVVPVSRGALADHLQVSERTLLRRLHEDKHFSAAESDRLYRLITLYSHAANVLGSLEAANEWMTSPALALGDQTPLAYATNEAGAKRVEQLLTRIDDGVYS